MEAAELRERVHDLQVSLKDGDDLAKAVSLIGDALERRVTEVRKSLEELREDGEVPDGDRLDEIVARVRDTLDTYEGRLSDRHQRMSELIREFQVSMGEQAAALSDLQAQLSDDTD